ncbi:hypothetical protein TNCV_4927581 [Trichonephila clavipes]|nr:hypothetical protein TNCV_4927581 [Trichonephila clavipes]
MLCSICFSWQLLPNTGLTCNITSTDSFIILESLQSPKDVTLGNLKFLRYFHLRIAMEIMIEYWIADIETLRSTDVGSTHTTLHRYLNFRITCAQWVPNQQTAGQPNTRMALSLSHLQRYHTEE